MSREDTRDAASADVVFDSACESPAEKHQKDHWFHDADAGTVTRFHAPERRARFDPKSVTGALSILHSVRCTHHDGHAGHRIYAAGFVTDA